MENDVKPFVDMFEEAEHAALDANDLATRCRNYYNGNQLTEEERAELSQRGQPPIVINKIRKEVNWMRGYEMKNRTDPRAFPRNPGQEDEELATTATDALRYVVDSTKYKKIRSQCWEGLLVEGVCGAEILHDFKPPMKEPKIVINRYSFDRLFYDPHSQEHDFSDARYKGGVIWSDMDQLIEEYPEKEDVIGSSVDTTRALDDTFEDKPYYKIWADPKRRRVRVVLMYYIENGTWKWVKYVKGGILEQGESQYVDEDGVSQCPLVLESMYVDMDNARHGIVKDFLDPQDEVNKRRSKALFQMSARQTWGVKGAVDSVKNMKRELSKPDGHVEVTQEAAQDARETGVLPFNIISQQDQLAGQFNLLQDSKNDIQVMGANGALMGESGASSGRQVMAEQQGGLVEIAPLYDRILDFDEAVFRQIWMRVQQFWTQEKWVRITDSDDKPRFVGLNKQVRVRDELQNFPPEAVQAWAYQNQIGPDDPRLDSVVRVENDVASMDVDIIIEEVPDTITLQGETFEQLVNLSTSQPGAVPIEILIEAAPNLDRDIKEKLLEHLEQQKQQQAQAMQGQQQAMQAQAQAEAQSKQAEAAKDMAQAMKYESEAMQPRMTY